MSGRKFSGILENTKKLHVRPAGNACHLSPDDERQALKKEFAVELNDLREEYSLEKESLLDDIREQRRARILLVRSVFLVTLYMLVVLVV